MTTGSPSDSAESEQSATTATVDLAALRASTVGMSDDDILGLGYDLYMKCCVRPAGRGEITTHDGHPVRFFPKRFDHAFFTSATRKDRGRAKDVVDASRVERIPWIVPILSGLVPHTECFRYRESYGKDAKEQRIYVVGPEQYILWLWTDKPLGFTFSSAYRASPPEIKRWVDRQTRIWPRDRN